MRANNNNKNPKLNGINEDYDDDNFLQVATAIPTHQTQIPSVRSISFANSVNVYSKVGHHHLRVLFSSISRLWLRRKLTKCKWFLPKKTGMASHSGPQLHFDVLLKECKKCKCLEAGCECDPNAVNPDELCSRNEQCVNCQCLPFGNPSSFFTYLDIFSWPGCDCDVNAANPNSFCLSGEVCKVS